MSHFAQSWLLKSGHMQGTFFVSFSIYLNIFLLNHIKMNDILIINYPKYLLGLFLRVHMAMTMNFRQERLT